MRIYEIIEESIHETCDVFEKGRGESRSIVRCVKAIRKRSVKAIAFFRNIITFNGFNSPLHKFGVL